MTKATLKRWQRDGLEALHALKYESSDKSKQIKIHAKRTVVLTDELLLAELVDSMNKQVPSN